MLESLQRTYRNRIWPYTSGVAVEPNPGTPYPWQDMSAYMTADILMPDVPVVMGTGWGSTQGLLRFFGGGAVLGLFW